jgi:hypothetical protein
LIFARETHLTRNRSIFAAVVIAGASLAFATPAMAATGAGATAQTTATQATVTQPPAPMDLRVDSVTTTSVTFQSDNPALPPQEATCTLDVYDYDVYVNGTDIGSTGSPGSPVAFVGGLAPHTTYSLQLQRMNICTGARSDLSAPLTVTTLG